MLPTIQPWLLKSIPGCFFLRAKWNDPGNELTDIADYKVLNQQIYNGFLFLIWISIAQVSSLYT